MRSNVFNIPELFLSSKLKLFNYRQVFSTFIYFLEIQTNNYNLPDRFQPWWPISAEISHLHERYCSAQVSSHRFDTTILHDRREIRRSTIPPTSKLGATTDNFLIEKLTSTFFQPGNWTQDLSSCTCDRESNRAFK